MSYSRNTANTSVRQASSNVVPSRSSQSSRSPSTYNNNNDFLYAGVSSGSGDVSDRGRDVSSSGSEASSSSSYD